MRAAAVAAVVLPGWLAAGCGGDAGAVDPASRAAAEARAEAAAQRLTGSLMKELQDALAAGGPGKAVGVCGGTAQRISAETEAAEGFPVRRTTLRWRNPRNEPDEFERGVLQGWEAGTAAVVSEVRPGPAGPELCWMKPLRLKAFCLTCHGSPDRIPPEVREELARRYPGDRATGYRDGDLRGAISVRIPLTLGK